MTEQDRLILLTAFAFAYKHGVTDIDKAIGFSKEYLLTSGDEEYEKEYYNLVAAFDKFKRITA